MVVVPGAPVVVVVEVLVVGAAVVVVVTQPAQVQISPASHSSLQAVQCVSVPRFVQPLGQQA